MANKSVLELAVGTGQWDAGLKKAKQALDNFTSAQGGLQQALEKDNGDMAKFVQMMTNMDSTAKTSKQQLREISNVLTDFTATYRTLTDEQKNSPFGQELAKGIQKLTERAGVLRDAMDDVALSIRGAASDTRLFDQMAQGMSVATAGFQGLTGAGKLLGIEMGNDVEVIAKLQAAMAITNSLTTIQTALQRESALMQGLSAAKTSINAAAHAVLSGQLTAAAIAQKALNLAMRAAPWAIAATAIYAVVTAISKSSEETDKETAKRNAATEAMKRERAERERLAQKARDHAGKVSSATGDMIAKYRVLQEEWNTLKTNQEKNDFIKDNTSAFNAFGTSIRNAADAQKFFVEQADKVIEVLKTMAEAEAFKDLLTDAIKKKYTTDPSKVDYKKYALSTNEISAFTPTQRWLGMYSGSYLYYDKNKYSAADDQKYIQDFINANKELKDAGITPNDYWSETSDTHRVFHLNYKAIGKIQDIRKSNIIKNATDELDGDVENFTKKYSDSIKKVQELQADMPLFNGGKGDGNGGSDNNQTELQKNNALIDQLSTEYVSASDERRAAIRKEIIELQELNEEFNRLKKEAVEGIDANNLLPDIPQSSGSTESYGEQLRKSIFADMQIEAQQADVNAIKNLMDVVIRNGIEGVDIPVDDLMERLFGDGGDIAGSYFHGIVEKINEQLREIGRDEIEIDAKGNVSKKGAKNNNDSEEDKKEAKLNETLSTLSGGMNNVVNGLNDLGVELPKGLSNVIGGIQTISSILTGISAIVSAIEVITAADTIIPFAGGGIVRAAGGTLVGSSYSGDNLRGIGPGGQIYGLNAGELVLNRAQAGALASQLQDMSRGTDLPPYLTGEMIYLGLQAYTRRSGMGEIITSNR